MQDIWVTDIMTREVSTCVPATTLRKVVDELHNQQFSCLVVVEDQRPVGIITERDMVTILADMLKDVSWDNLSVANFMTVEPVLISEDLTLFEAVEVMREENVRHTPVVNRQGELIGLMTQTDLINGIYRFYMDSGE